MGAVYEAEQDQPRRRVALKIIRAAWASPELLCCFELESEALGNPLPVQLEPGSMPANDRIRLHQDQRLSPLGQEAAQRDPEKSVAGRESWLRTTASQDRELLPQREILQKKISASTKRADQHSGRSSLYDWVSEATRDTGRFKARTWRHKPLRQSATAAHGLKS
jgi:hypothetical protein